MSLVVKMQQRWLIVIRWAVTMWLPSLIEAEARVPKLDQLVLAYQGWLDAKHRRILGLEDQLLNLGQLYKVTAKEAHDLAMERNMLQSRIAAVEDVCRAMTAKQEEEKRQALEHAQQEATAIDTAKSRAVHAVEIAIHKAFFTVGLNPDSYVSYYDISQSGRLNEILYYTNAYLGDQHPLRTVQDIIDYLVPNLAEALKEPVTT